MQAVFSPLIAAVLLIHAVLGCCWLHACPAIDTQPTHHVAAHTCCHHEHSSQHEHEVPGQPCDCRWECHATCVYVAEKASVDAQQPVVDFLGLVPLLAIFQSADLDLAGDSARPSSSPVDSHLCAQPHVRLHILNQLWLI